MNLSAAAFQDLLDLSSPSLARSVAYPGARTLRVRRCSIAPHELLTRPKELPLLTPSDNSPASPDLSQYLSGEVKRGNAATEATRVLREAILDSAIPPGTWLREETVSKLIGVSRTPVREAVSRLVEEGLVERHEGAGVRVTTLTVEDMSIVYSIRGSLESLAARRIVDHAAQTQVAALAELHDQMSAAGAAQDVAEFNRLNVLFHHELGAAAGNAYLARMLSTVEVAMRRFGSRSYSPERITEIMQEHQLILDALSRRDADAAAKAAEDHAAQARRSTVSKLVDRV